MNTEDTIQTEQVAAKDLQPGDYYIESGKRTYTPSLKNAIYVYDVLHDFEQVFLAISLPTETGVSIMPTWKETRKLKLKTQR
jgi:hypothetical protein